MKSNWLTLLHDDRVMYYTPNLVVTVNGKRQKVYYPAIVSDGTPCTTSRNQEGVRFLFQRCPRMISINQCIY